MNHKVRNVQELYVSAEQLYKQGVTGGDSSADGIIHNLVQGIENLKQNWKGVDAGLRLQEVIKVHNSMVNVRNNLASLSIESSRIAVNYREIQMANGARLDTLQPITTEPKTAMGDYFDGADTVDINPEAEVGKGFIDSANNALDGFESFVRAKHNEIMGNWLAGAGRNEAESAFESYMSNVKKYKQTLSEVSDNITSALQNYNF